MTELVIEDAEACQLAAELVGADRRQPADWRWSPRCARSVTAPWHRRRRHDRIMAITREIARGSSMAA